MGKIYLKRIESEEAKRSCKGCYFFNIGHSQSKYLCTQEYRNICRGRAIFKQIFLGTPKISNKSVKEMIEEDCEISYSHKNYDGPGVNTFPGLTNIIKGIEAPFQGFNHSVPPGATTGMSSAMPSSPVDAVRGTPRTGYEVKTCGSCGSINNFKEVYLICNIPFKREVPAYACNRCGIIRMKV